MADPLSITSGLVAILQLASTVVQYLNAVIDASDERQQLILELGMRFEISSRWNANVGYTLGSITGFLYLLKESADTSSQSDLPSAALNSLCSPHGPLFQLKEALQELAAKLRPANGKLKKAGKALRWPFQKSEVHSILSRIERQKTMFGLALQNDNNEVSRLMAEDIGNIREGLTSIHKTVANLESHTIGKFIFSLKFASQARMVLKDTIKCTEVSGRKSVQIMSFRCRILSFQ